MLTENDKNYDTTIHRWWLYGFSIVVHFKFPVTVAIEMEVSYKSPGVIAGECLEHGACHAALTVDDSFNNLENDNVCFLPPNSLESQLDLLGRLQYKMCEVPLNTTLTVSYALPPVHYNSSRPTNSSRNFVV